MADALKVGDKVNWKYDRGLNLPEGPIEGTVTAIDGSTVTVRWDTQFGSEVKHENTYLIKVGYV